MLPSPAARHSRPAGAVVLTALPPFFHDTWLGAGVVRLFHELEGNELPVRVLRPLDDLTALPEALRAEALRTMALDRPMAERRAATRALLDAQPDLVEALLEGLLAGPEQVFLLSTWRTNVDLTLELCRRLAARRPTARVVLGGPEAIERGAELWGPGVDVVVSGAGEGVIVPLVRALLDGQPGRARRLPRTAVAPRHADDDGPLHAGRPISALGPVDYGALAPLVRADPQPRLPTVLNTGCVFNCGFCTNKSVYPQLGWGAVETCAEEVRRIGQAWAAAWPDAGTRPALSVELCDATVNGWPEQYARLCAAIEAARPQVARISANVVVDQRLDGAAVEAAARAGFTDLFFGLESGSDRIRRAMKKPGTAAQVWQALERAEAASGGRVHMGFGVVVGWPDETEAEFHRSVALLERIATLSGLTPNANVSPLFRTPQAHDRDTLPTLDGPSYGVLWRGPGPAGDPAVRCRRMMGLVERFHGVLTVDCPVPVERLARWMLPPEEAAFVDRWAAIHSSRPARDGEPPAAASSTAASSAASSAAASTAASSTAASSTAASSTAASSTAASSTAASSTAASSTAAASAGAPPAAAPIDLPLEQALAALGLDPAPTSPVLPPAALRHLFSLGPDRADQLRVEVGHDKAEITLLHPGGAPLVALVVRPLDPAAPCYARTATLNVSLVGQRHSPGQLQLVDRVLERVRRREAG